MSVSENPLVDQSFISKIKRTKKSKEKEIQALPIEAHLLGMNDAIRICANACGCCWDKEVPDDFEGMAKYVANRSKIGHTSILEHSNFVLYLSIPEIYRDDLLYLLSNTRYLNTALFSIEEDSNNHLIIGGSFRGYADLFREANDLNNAVLMSIRNMLYNYAHSCAFEDICDMGLMDKSMFKNIEPDEDYNKLLNDLDYDVESDLFTILGLDSITKLYTNLYHINKAVSEKVTTYDLIKFVTISVMFKNMSRTCTHQLVRHRNAITQESQRYVDYSDACFNSPDMFKPDKYDSEHKYKVRFGPCLPVNMTLSEIGKAMCDIYGMLQNPSISGEHHLLKEDARAFLPSNVQCKKIYMTFTYKNFLKFLNLREDKHAQAEIRLYATAIGDWFRANTEFSTKELCDLYTNPRLNIEDPFKIDVDEDIVEEDVEITEDDYIKAAGLDSDSDSE